MSKIKLEGSAVGTGELSIEADNDAMIFSTGSTPTEAMRIDSSGNLLVGKTTTAIGTAGALITNYGTFQSLNALADYSIFNQIAYGTGKQIEFRSVGTAVGNITSTSSSTSYNTSSDYRLKEDWQPMSGSIDRVKSLNPVNFAWKSSGERVDGFLAHEAAEVVPEAVSGTKDAMTTEEYEVTPAVLDDDGNVVTEAVMGEREVPDYQGIDQSKLTPLLTSALQEAIARIETLEAEVTALKGIE
jgi:hypothetical protein